MHNKTDHRITDGVIIIITIITIIYDSTSDVKRQRKKSDLSR